MSEAGKAVFLSYASQDKEVAQRICDALRAAGVEVWFDKSELRGGDAWDALIRKRIKECVLFVPIITPTTNARAEGYFRLEWKLAVDRSHLMADDAPFLFPIVVGDVNDATARVPDKFRELQWTRLRLDETPGDLAARVARLLSGTPTDNRQPTTDNRAGRRRLASWQWWMIFPILGTIMGLLFAAVPMWKAFKGPLTKRPAPTLAASVDDKSVAVLAFANLNDDKAGEYFSDGISEELLNVLAKLPGLKVSARTSAFYFKGKDMPIPEIAKQLGVAYVVEGSVRKQGDKVRITAQLIKADDGFHVWSDTFTRDLKDIFAVQDEIAGVIAKNLQLKMGVAAIAERPVDGEAYRLVLLARNLVQSSNAKEDLIKARQYLEEALGRDPKFALAWSWLSIARWSCAANGWEAVVSGYAAAREAAERALALAPDLPDAYTATGLVYYGGDWDWRRAQDAFEHALALAPGNASILGNLARLATTMGDNDKAVRLGRRAVELDPLNAYAQYTLCMALFQAGRFEELGRQVTQLVQLSRFGTKQEVFALMMLKRSEEALRVAERGEGHNRTFLLALTNWDVGHKSEADKYFARLKAEAADSAAYQIAELYAWRGAVDEAFEWLETSYRQRDAGMIWLKNDPLLHGLHGDPRWKPLLRKMGLADDQLK
jgi:TolB-like protein/Tfp pilus assembly protein PilF